MSGEDATAPALGVTRRGDAARTPVLVAEAHMSGTERLHPGFVVIYYRGVGLREKGGIGRYPWNMM